MKQKILYFRDEKSTLMFDALGFTFFLMRIKFVRNDSKFWPVSFPWSLWFCCHSHNPNTFGFSIEFPDFIFLQCNFPKVSSFHLPWLSKTIFSKTLLNISSFSNDRFQLFINPINWTRFLWFGLLFFIPFWPLTPNWMTKFKRRKVYILMCKNFYSEKMFLFNFHTFHDCNPLGHGLCFFILGFVYMPCARWWQI